MDKRVEHVHDQLTAFYPEYTAQGNMTRLIYQDPEADKTSSMIDPRQVESVKRALARFYAVDLRAQADILRRTYNRRIILHFYLPDGRVFVPFKLRERRISGDACYGFVDIAHIARLVPGNKPYVLMRSGERLSLYSSISTARLAYFMGWEILWNSEEN